MRFTILLLAVVFALSCRGQHPSEYYPTMRKQFVYDSISSLALDVTYTEDYNSLRPVLVYIHGGGWWQDDKSEWSKTTADYFLNNDIISVSADYTLAPDIKNKTLTPNGIYPKNVIDVANSIKWVRQNISKYGGDPNNIFLVGYSAGTFLIDLVIMQNRLPKMKDYIKGIISIDAGPYKVMNRSLMKRAQVDSVWMNAFGTSNFSNDDLNPAHLITKNDWLPPFLLICGTSLDRQSPNSHFNDILLDNMHNCQLILVDQVDHQHIRYFIDLNLPFKIDLTNFVKNHSKPNGSNKL